MDKLTEMHLLLREFGWEPEAVDTHFWMWTRPDQTWVITTQRYGVRRCSITCQFYWDWGNNNDGVLYTTRSPRSLEKRLKELATASPS